MLARADYRYEVIRLAELLRAIPKWKDLPIRYVDEYIDDHMTAGDEFRKITGRRDALTLMGVSRIKDLRLEKVGRPQTAVPNQAYIFRSLRIGRNRFAA